MSRDPCMEYDLVEPDEVLELSALSGRLARAIELAVQQAKIPLQELVFAHGAVVYKGSRIFGWGHNEERPIAHMTRNVKHFRALSDYTAHAEMMAIKDAKWFNTGSTLVVVRWMRSNCLGNSAPCNMCMPKLMNHPCLTRMYYSMDAERIGMKRLK